MTWWPKLQPHQLALLRRIAEGSEPVTSREPTLAPTVYALRGRRLVTTPRMAGVWTAVITDAGRHYLEHGEYLDLSPHTSPRTAKAPSTATIRTATRRVSSDSEPDHGVSAPPRTRPRRRASERDTANSDPIMVPAGDGHDDAGKARDASETGTVLSADVTQLISALRRDPQVLQVSPDNLPRALALLQSLADQAERRGSMLALGHDGLAVVVDGRRYRFAMSEEPDTVDHLPDPDELDEAGAYPWQRIRPQRRTVPSGRLVLELTDASATAQGRRSRWADRRRWRLDDKLAELLSEVEQRARLDAQRDTAAAEAEAERQRQWQQAMVDARARYEQAHFIAALDRQVDGWKRAQGARAYAEAILNAAGPDGMTEELRRWVGWIREYADSVDPFRRGDLVPPLPPEPGPADLQPYLGRWSPFGPHGYR